MKQTTFLFLFVLLLSACYQAEHIPVFSTAPYLRMNTAWADSTLQSMTLEEKIGQLIILKSNLKHQSTQDSLHQWVATGKTGGLMLHDLPVESFIKQTEESKKLAAFPLFIGTNEKVALNNQFSDVVHFPEPATVASLTDDIQHEKLAELYSKQCQLLGINFCMAPSLFENKKETKNYNYQAFESDKNKAFKRSHALLADLTQKKILTFGDNFSDYYNLPQDTTGFLDSVLYKYYRLTSHGLSGLKMDEKVFNFDGWNSLQPYFLQQYLQTHLSFKGLMVAEVTDDVFIDRLIHSGVDLFIVNNDINSAFAALKRWINMGLMSENVLDAKVKKVLLAKAWMENKAPNAPFLNQEKEALAQVDKQQAPSLYHKKTPKPEPALEQHTAKAMFASHLFYEDASFDDLLWIDKERYNSKPLSAYFKNNQWRLYVQKMYEEAIVLANNPNKVIPFVSVYKQDFQIFKYSNNSLKTFETYFKKYASVRIQQPDKQPEKSIQALPVDDLQKSTSILILDRIDLDSTQYQDFIASINTLSQTSKVVLINFGNPYNLQYFNEKLAVVQTFERNPWTEAIIAQLLFGGTSTYGKLPIDISPIFPKGAGSSIHPSRLKYTTPEEVGIAAERLRPIEAIAEAAIQSKAFPGCQVLVAKDGKVIYDKAFGYHTYEQKVPVQTSDLYDVASITKVAATTLASMKLHEQQQFDILDRLQDHLPFNRRSALKYIRLRDLFVHKSGLQANMPIVKYLYRRDSIVNACNRYYCNQENEPYTLKIAEDFYINKYYADTIWMDLQKLRVDKRRRYKYSDVNFYLLQKLVEEKTGTALNDYVSSNFYNPLGLQISGFNPLEKVSPKQVAPTAVDSRWRKQLLQGYVHDETAAINGGVAGNAGLFMNAEEMAILFQMLLNGGIYGNNRYLQQETIDYFTTARYGNHRGLGFDKPRSSKSSRRPYAQSAPSSTFGHTGFTGTCVWADPDNDLVFIFLSNRIYPSVKNKQLSRENVRGRMHQVVYDALGTFKETY